MTESVARCPYCVLGNEFMPMLALADGGFVCEQCGHMTIPGKDFKCHCSKCVDMRTTQNLQSVRSRRCSAQLGS